MKKNLFSIWQCTNCFSKNTNLIIEDETDEINFGHLVCQKCGKKYYIKRGILETSPQLSASMKDEMTSVREKTRPNQGLVFPLEAKQKINDNWLLSLPGPHYHAGNWNPKYDIEFIIKKVGLKRDDWILDLGSGVCWTTRNLATISTHCIAVDMINDKYLGLESAKTYIDDSGHYFDRINSGMDNLPFQDNSFDLVLTNCSAHHADDLPKLLKEIKRVLKKDGIYTMSNELTQGMFKKSHLENNDHYYTAKDYVRALKNAGFKPRVYFPDSIHRSLMDKKLKRKSGKWKSFGEIASGLYQFPFVQKYIRKNAYLFSRLFGLPLIIISTH